MTGKKKKCAHFGGKWVRLPLDTGAEVTAISGATHQHLGKPKLPHPDKLLYGPSRQPLKVMSKFEGTFTHKGRQSHQQVYVVTGLKTSLLGLPTITALNLAAPIDTTHMRISTKTFGSSSQGCLKAWETLVKSLSLSSSQRLNPMHSLLPAMYHYLSDHKWKKNSNEWNPWE